MDVGFSIQADLMGGGSLLHAATGRLLKALSDGGIDFYAVAAAVHLGKHIPILEAHEAEVSRLLNARTGRVGFLAKALSIGWGHSEIAIELARTRAGTSALLTIGALTTSSTIYAATQAFSELLTLSGCRQEELPNIDVLKAMITYLAPFMADLGFRKVFQYVVSTSKRGCSQVGQRLPLGLEATGETSEWPRAIRQLVLSAQRCDTLHLQVAQRGAWLAAYASHILGMAVQLLLDEHVLWESAGSRGTAAIQLGQITPQRKDIIVSSANFHIVNSPKTQQGQNSMGVDYVVGEALRTEILLDTRITQTISDSIERAIVRMSSTLVANLKMKSRNYEGNAEREHRINGEFSRYRKAIQSHVLALGISLQNHDIGITTKYVRNKSWTGTITQSHGLSYLDGTEAVELQTICGTHGSNQGSLIKIPNCLCCRIGGLIHGFGSTVLALMQCVYNPVELRVQADVINGSRTSPWSRATLASTNGKVDGFATSAQLFVHLSQLFHGLESLGEPDIINHSQSEILAVSIDSVTLYYRALLDEECFDDEGRMLAIVSGRVSSKGVLRRLVREGITQKYSEKVQFPLGDSAKLTPGATVVPNYAKGPVQATMQVTNAETDFWVETRLSVDNADNSEVIGLAMCIHSALLTRRGRSCPHSRGQPLVVPETESLLMFASTLSGREPSSNRDLVFFALQGSTLEQLLQMGIGGTLGMLMQGNSCLGCVGGLKRPDYGQDGWYYPIIMT